MALKATIHCLSGCSIGEVLGMMAGAGLDLSHSTNLALGIVLAFVFGFFFDDVALGSRRSNPGPGIKARYCL